MSLARELHERRQDLFGRLLALLERGDAEVLIEHLGQAADRLSPPDDETAEADPDAVA
jgi:hypothetical protein